MEVPAGSRRFQSPDIFVGCWVTDMWGPRSVRRRSTGASTLHWKAAERWRRGETDRGSRHAGPYSIAWSVGYLMGRLYAHRNVGPLGEVMIETEQIRPFDIWTGRRRAAS